MWLVLLVVFAFSLAPVQLETVVGHFSSSCRGNTDWKRGKRELGNEIRLWLESVKIITSNRDAGKSSCQFAIQEVDDEQKSVTMMVEEDGVVWRRHDGKCHNYHKGASVSRAVCLLRLGGS